VAETVRGRSAGGIGWTLAVAALGVLCGLGLFTFAYGDGTAYLQDDPAGCANCHVMQEHYDAWQKSSHASFATCNDCHLRHDFVGKWVTKADNGFFHSLAFTTGSFPDPIQIKPRNRRVTQDACLGCHAQHVYAVLPAVESEDALLCVHCHADVGHALR
jgi:cytochrome c nitrite reductase small subunit